MVVWMPKKYTIYLVWKSSSIHYAAFAIVGACQKISLEIFFGACGSLRLVVFVGGLSYGV